MEQVIDPDQIYPLMLLLFGCGVLVGFIAGLVVAASFRGE